MLANPWLAIDGSTSPASLAREVRRAWEQFLGGDLQAPARETITASWARSQAAGVDPFAELAAPSIGDPDEVAALWRSHPLAATVPLIRELLGQVAEEAGHLLVVTDADGMLLSVEGNEQLQHDAAGMINFVAGASWSESNAGTNAIGTALAAQHAVQVFAGEHFNEVVQTWTCAAAPIYDPDRGELLGVIDVTGRATSAHPHTFVTAVATARAVESQLRLSLQENDARLRSRYGELVGRGRRRALVTATGRVLGQWPDGWLGEDRLELPAGGGEASTASGEPLFAEAVGHSEAFIVRDARPSRAAPPSRPVEARLLGDERPSVTVAGRVIPLRPRQADILALLMLRPHGWSSDELAAALYGDGGQRTAARVEVSRLRALLGGGIDMGSYRLSVGVASDVGRVQGLLDAGEVAAAVEQYPGPLLARSEAPGVVRERQTLDAWMRHAVLSSGQLDTLWRWLQGPSGQDDLAAWKRLLSELDFYDPRRAYAAARIRSLRV